MTSEYIAGLKTHLVKEIDKIFVHMKLTDLATLAESFEDFLRGYTLTTIRETCATLVVGAKENPSSLLFVYSGIEFEIIVAEEIVRSEVLQLVFIRRDTRTHSRRLRSHTLRIHGYGRYQKIQILYSSEIPLNLEILSEIALAIFETGYKWLEGAVVSVVANAEIDLSKALYSFVRTVFKEPELLRHFWFVSVTKGQGIYLFDEDAAANALTIASLKAAPLGISPLSLTSEILTCLLPYELIATREAVSSGSCINIDLTQSKYLETDSPLATAEIVMYGSEVISVFPIVRHGNAFLVAVFPTQNRYILEREITLYQDELARRFHYFQNHLERSIAALKSVSQKWSYGKVGELLGGIAKSFLDQ
jgi:hypothetical protein